jgi:hypothetical protein
MDLTIALNFSTLNQLDLSPALEVLQPLRDREELLRHEQQLTFQVEYPREPGDPRELSEIPEVRLWFIRLDSLYPWLPFLLNWKVGELGRYTAMLVPHQFHRNDGIQYNPEALEIFVMQKIFVLSTWLKGQGIEGTSRLKGMTQMLGYELDPAFFELL